MVREAAQQSSDPDDFLRRLRVSPDGAYALRGEFEMERPRRRSLRWVSRPVELGEGVGQLTVLTDLTADMDLMRERDHLARTDPVTGLMNRRAAEEVLAREGSRAQRFGSRMSLALIDLDHFKQVNDRHGHAAGDEALRATARDYTRRRTRGGTGSPELSPTGLFRPPDVNPAVQTSAAMPLPRPAATGGN